MNLKFLALILALAVTACAQNESSNMTLEPGPRGTFVAVGATTDLNISQPAGDSQPAFQFHIKSQPAKGISIGTAVGDGLESKNSAQSFVPASITKVITSALAMKRRGTDFTFKTTLSWTADDDGTTAQDLGVLSDGDPLTTKANLRAMAVELKNRGVQRLSGVLHLVSADRRKDLTLFPFGMDDEDKTRCYGARAQSFNLERNCSTLQIRAWKSAHWLDPLIQVPVSFDTNPRADVAFAIQPLLANPQPFLQGYLIQAVPPKGLVEVDLPIPDAKEWYGSAFLEELKWQGIDIGAIQEFSEKPAPGDQSIDFNSPALKDIARMMNKMSDNFLAEGMFKSLAGLEPVLDISSAGIKVLQEGVLEWLNGNAALASEIALFDGAGLSRANRVTPRAFLAALTALTREPFFQDLFLSLPIAGVDGTLKNRMGSSAAAGLVRAKTGTLKGAYQLAGYIPKLGEQNEIVAYVPFVILSATTPENSAATRAFQDKVLAELTVQINKGKVTAPVAVAEVKKKPGKRRH